VSDLHCPARVYVAVPGDGAAHEAAEQALVELAASERVVRVLARPGDAAGARLAGRLGVPLDEEPGLAGLEVAETRPVAPVLDEVADAFPGEAVLVVAAGPEPAAWVLARDTGGWTVRSVEPRLGKP
jgi:hypothetical protein